MAGRKVRKSAEASWRRWITAYQPNRDPPIVDPIAKQIETMAENCRGNGLTVRNEPHNGVIHVVVPEHGLCIPAWWWCGDSHTATHGAFGALAFGIGTSEVEHVMATQTLPQKKSKTMQIVVNGELSKYASAKDIALAITGKIGTVGGTGYDRTYRPAIRALSMEGRMTLCNMAIEAGARAGLVAPDEKTYEYLKGREFAPSGQYWERRWRTGKRCPVTKAQSSDATVVLDAAEIAPQVSWGTSPEQVSGVDGVVPALGQFYR